jgi:branched-chain amino acid transport system substrate-binding protein
MKNRPENNLKIDQRRRSLVAGSVALGAGAILGAPAVLAQSKAPLRIGLINSFSKSFAALGQSNLNGMNLYLEQIGWNIAGRKVELLREDDEINPQIGLQKLKRLVESERCDIVCGIQASNVLAAIPDYLRQSKQLFICSGAGSTDFSYIKVPTAFRVSTSFYQPHYAMGGWFYDNVAKQALNTASDFAGGRGIIDIFRFAFQEKGGKIVKEIYPPLGNNDFSAYLADIRSTNPAAVFAFYAGTDAVRFTKQYAEFGLKGKIKLVASGFMTEGDVLPAQGNDALGIVSSLHYSNALDNPSNRAFVTAYRAKYKEYPNVYSEYGYTCAAVIHEALKATDGNTSDKEKVRQAILALKLNVPRGAISMDPATQNVVHDVYIREVAEVDGRLTNKIIGTIKNVRDPVRPLA